MSDLQTIDNIKIPYPVEGVIRTAQLDDTVTPQDSVQLAVNMNFDRVGAVQTRPGVTEYADSLGEEIKSFGKLRNSIIPAGYDLLFQVGDENELVNTFTDPAAVKISDTKVAVFWQGADGDGFCQNFETDVDSGVMTPIGTALEFDTTDASVIRAMSVTDSIVIVVWRVEDNDGFVQCFDVSGESITAMSSPLEFDTANANDITLAQVDSDHFICFYTSSSNNGVATIFEVNTGTGAVTEPGSPLTFEGGFNLRNSCCALGDGTHFVNAWVNGSGGQIQTFEVNTGTWEITALSSALGYASGVDVSNLMPVGDSQHVMNVYEGSSPTGRRAQAFEVNLTTYAVTTVGTPVVFGGSGNDTFAIAFGDGEHFISFYSGDVGEGYAQMIEMDPSTFDTSLVGETLEGYDFANAGYTTGVVMSATKVFAVWGNVDGLQGKSVMFKTTGSVVNDNWLYAGHGSEVSNWGGSSWTSRRSGLAEVSKPRFSQYLNYIWMVNGNVFIGGDPVATSNGGAFGTDLVPENFPPGDFIHAGFEGRVWVLDKTLGVVHYTDIVQFVPPDVYTFSYNPNTNFISTLSPQTGQEFTGVFRVPRALLVFTQDYIYRIYGATSADSYPAYDVGTYSQESIVETKAGIFFHHSSGIYQFDYGSQPVEVSRRIIDFIKAIPRSYYENIKGVYDGFDTVQWYVGSVTVEGVVFSNCVLRYTISTQVWTIYDYTGNNVTAMILYDDGTTLTHLMGTDAGLVGSIDTGNTDFGEPFYFEMIDRWRSFTDMYCETKALDGINVYSENAAGANISYQVQKSGPNEWNPLATVDERNNSLFPTNGTKDFDVMRLRIAGNTRGPQVVIHGIEIPSLTVKGYEQN